MADLKLFLQSPCPPQIPSRLTYGGFETVVVPVTTLTLLPTDPLQSTWSALEVFLQFSPGSSPREWRMFRTGAVRDFSERDRGLIPTTQDFFQDERVRYFPSGSRHRVILHQSPSLGPLASSETRSISNQDCRVAGRLGLAEGAFGAHVSTEEVVSSF